MLSPVLVRQAQRFAVSGLLATGVHVLVATGFIRFLFAAPSVANGIAFVIAALVSYALNTLWSFSSPLHGRNLLRFVFVSIVGCILAVAVSGAGQFFGLHYLYGIGLVVLTVPPVTFLLHRLWTYR